MSIKVNGTTITYENNVFYPTLFGRYSLQFEPTVVGNYCVWEITQYPPTLRGSDVVDPESFFDSGSTQIDPPEDDTLFYTIFNRVGDYVIRANEYTSEDVLYSTNYLYIQVKDLIREVTVPFAGEGYEFDTTEGWAAALKKSILSINEGCGSHAVYAVSTDTLAVGDLAEIVDTRIVNDTQVIFNVTSPNPALPKNSYGIVIGIYEDSYVPIDSAYMGAGETVYIVAYFGAFVVEEDLSYHISDGMFYFNNSSKTITADNSDTYIGKYDYSAGVLLIENPITGYNTNIDLAGVEGDMIYHDGSDWVALNIGTVTRYTLQTKDSKPVWGYPTTLFREARNTSAATIPMGALVEVSGGKLRQYKREDNEIRAFVTVDDTPITTGVINYPIKNYSMGDDVPSHWILYVIDNGGSHDLVARKFNSGIAVGGDNPITLLTNITENSIKYDFVPLDYDMGALIVFDNGSLTTSLYLVIRGDISFTVEIGYDIYDPSYPGYIDTISDVKMKKVGDNIVVVYSYIDGTSGTVGLNSFCIKPDLADTTSWVIGETISLLEQLSDYSVAPEFDMAIDNDEYPIVFWVGEENAGLQGLSILNSDTCELFAGIFYSIGETLTTYSKPHIISMQNKRLIIGALDEYTKNIVCLHIYAANVLTGNYYTSPTWTPDAFTDFENSTSTGDFHMCKIDNVEFAIAFDLLEDGATHWCLYVDKGTISYEQSNPIDLNNILITGLASGNYKKLVTDEDPYYIQCIAPNYIFTKTELQPQLVVSAYVSNTVPAQIGIHVYEAPLYPRHPALAGIALEEIIVGAYGDIGIGGVVYCSGATFSAGSLYYARDDGILTTLRTRLFVGVALASTYLLYTPRFLEL